jgi:hypothetical protein
VESSCYVTQAGTSVHRGPYTKLANSASLAILDEWWKLVVLGQSWEFFVSAAPWWWWIHFLGVGRIGQWRVHMRTTRRSQRRMLAWHGGLMCRKGRAHVEEGAAPIPIPPNTKYTDGREDVA